MKFVFSLVKEIADVANSDAARMMGAILLKNFIINKTRVSQILLSHISRMKDMKAFGSQLIQQPGRTSKKHCYQVCRHLLSLSGSKLQTAYRQ
jgi:hypothetical protein